MFLFVNCDGKWIDIRMNVTDERLTTPVLFIHESRFKNSNTDRRWMECWIYDIISRIVMVETISEVYSLWCQM